MVKKKPSISLIVAVYKNPKFLELVLLSCLNQSFKDFEIIIADDGSGDDIRSVIGSYSKKFNFPIIHCWHDDSGFRKTIIANIAVLTANSDYLIFIDGDCILHNRFFERHWRNKDFNVVLSGRRVRLDKVITKSITNEDVTSRRIEKITFWVKNCQLNEIKHGIFIPFSSKIENFFRTKCWRIIGCNFSLHKSDFLSINGYDERIIGRGMEDSNLHERAYLKGLRFKSVVREALQYHLFHTFDPVPHSQEAINEFCNPVDSWTPFGIVK